MVMTTKTNKGEAMTQSTYIQKLVVGDVLTGIEQKSIYKVITPRIVNLDTDAPYNKRPVINDTKIHEWHFVNKSFKDLPKQLTKKAIEIDSIKISNDQYNWICNHQILTGEHFFN